MKKNILLIIILCLFVGCAVVGSHTRYVPNTTIATKIGWWEQGYDSGKPDFVVYSKQDVTFYVHVETPYEDKPYMCGPCLLLPLPIIPFLGVANRRLDGFVIVEIGTRYPTNLYKLISADLIVDKEVLSPKIINNRGILLEDDPNFNFYAFNYSDGQFPLSFNEKWHRHSLAFDINGKSIDSFELIFKVNDWNGASYLEDKILFKKEKSTYFRCIL